MLRLPLVETPGSDQDEEGVRGKRRHSPSVCPRPSTSKSIMSPVGVGP